MIKEFLRKLNGAVKFDDILEEFKKKKRFDGALQWSIEDWILILARGGGQKKRFQCCLNPNSSRHILHFRANQGHSGGIAVDPRIYRVHVSEMHFNSQKWIDSGRTKSQRRKTICVLHCSKPMEDDKCMEGTPRDLTKPRIVPKKVLGNLINIREYWFSLKLVQERGFQFYQTRSHAIVLFASRKWYA